MRCCARVAKAASISRSVLALKTSILQPDRARRLLHVSQLALDAGMFGLTRAPIACRLRHQLMQQAEPLRF